jgi:hypothetical protein
MSQDLPRKSQEILGRDVKRRATQSIRDNAHGFSRARANHGEIRKVEEQTGLEFVAEGRDSTVWKKGDRVIKANDPEKFPLVRIKEISYTHKILALIFPDYFVAPSQAESNKVVAFTNFPYVEGDDFRIDSPRNLHRETMYQFFRESGLLHPVQLDYAGKGNLKVTETGAHVYVDYVHDLILSREDKVKILTYLLDRHFDHSVIEQVDMYCDCILALKDQ